MKPLLAAVVVVSLATNAYLAYKVWVVPAAAQHAQSTGATVVMQTPGGVLEVSTITAEERFDSSTNHTILGVPVGKTVAQIRVPAVYRYHIPLAKDWSLRAVGDALIVVAPAVRPTLPVAIDTARLEAFASGLWSPITGADAVASLQKTLTPSLGEKAATPQLILLQREAARKTVAEFIHKWVIEQPRWKGAKPPVAFVFFADEPLGMQAAPLLTAP